MSMKNPSSPRRLYSTRGTMVFLFKGKRYCPAGESAFVTKAPCTVVEEHKDGSLTVKQRLPKKAGITEVWVEFAELPRQCKDELGRVRVKTHGEGMIPRPENAETFKEEKGYTHEREHEREQGDRGCFHERDD